LESNGYNVPSSDYLSKVDKNKRKTVQENGGAKDTLKRERISMRNRGGDPCGRAPTRPEKKQSRISFGLPPKKKVKVENDSKGLTYI
jgi:hypothetical protein